MPMILVIVDGMEDDAVLNGETPLEAAACTTLTRMARLGACGMLENVPEGLPVDSLTCISTLFGVLPEAVPSGRAFLEALSAGITLGVQDAVCRCNLVSLDADGRLVGSCSTMPRAQLDEVLKRLSNAERTLYHLGSYKNILLLRGGAEETSLVHTVMPHAHQGEIARNLLPQGSSLAGRMRRIALESCTAFEGAYMLFPWDISVRQTLPSFQSLHGLSASCVCATEIVKGLCMAMGITVVIPDGATAEADTNLRGKADAICSRFGQTDLAIVHINGADELSHRCDALGKARFLARVDAEFLAPLEEYAPEGTRILVCSDHATLSQNGQHRGNPQKFVLYEKGGTQRGSLGVFSGRQAVSLLRGNCNIFCTHLEANA